jgi:ribonuclease HII
MDLDEVKRLLNLCSYEDELFSDGYDFIAGVDEVGRGSLAGPVVAAAVILDRKKMFIEKLDDSKKINKNIRKKIFRKIIKCCACWSFASVSNIVIDRISLGKANILVMKKAIKKLKIKPDLVITDALDIKMKKKDFEIIPLINGDELSASVAAASILAKVIRDSIMIKLARIYPEYDLHINKGYGTKKHQICLQKYGPSDIHRLTFKSVLT